MKIEILTTCTARVIRGELMKSALLLLIMAIMYSSASGAALPGNVSTRVYFRDSNTPLDLADPNVPWVYRDIMTGTHLKIIVDSNANGDWSGGLLIPAAEVSVYGDLYGYGSYPDYQDSILPNAGEESTVDRSDDDIVGGFFLYAGLEAIPGDWFIIDYNALSAGTCHVGLYDDNWSYEDPFYTMSFTQVPSRDFNGDHIVNFADFSLMGLYWGVTNCSDPNGCGKADFYSDETINFDDLALFVDFWLERTN
jgi:hypothetical protein